MIDDNSKEFIARHIGPSEDEQSKMLNLIGAKNLDELIKNTVPEKILLTDELKIEEPSSENDTLKRLKSISKQNEIFRNFIGMGYYNSITPNVILRNILENPGWYTSYTPYQPEVAQGRLEMLLNFQQLIIDLTGLDIANASLLDESTAAAEAVGLSQRLDKNNSKFVFISDTCNPQTIDLIKTRTEPFGIKLLIGNQSDYLSSIKEKIICGVLAYPDTYGSIVDPSEAISLIHKREGKAILVADLLSLTKLKTPGELGADIAVGSSQRFGIPMGYGGPHAAFFATKEEFKRSMPGRIIGVSKDRYGKKAYRLSLQTREQHIRRDKATSNICTAQALLAIISAAFAIYHGPEGILKIANRTSKLAKLFADGLKAGGFEILSDQFFDTVTIKTGSKTKEIFNNALREKINLRNIDDKMISLLLMKQKNLMM
jgi:glycine dehydrogenase